MKLWVLGKRIEDYKNKPAPKQYIISLMKYYTFWGTDIRFCLHVSHHYTCVNV